MKAFVKIILQCPTHLTADDLEKFLNFNKVLNKLPKFKQAGDKNYSNAFTSTFRNFLAELPKGKRSETGQHYIIDPFASQIYDTYLTVKEQTSKDLN